MKIDEPSIKKFAKKTRTELDVEIERIAREQGVKPYDPNEPFDDPGISDEELEEFLEWRRQVRKAGAEANEKEWLS